MKTYEITIKPLSGFGTPLKGDTLFGHFIWQLVYDQNVSRDMFHKLLHDYTERPFIVFSSAFPKYIIRKESFYALPAPSLTPDHLFPMPEAKKKRIAERKKVKGKRWMIVCGGGRFNFFKEMVFYDDDEITAQVRKHIGEETRKLIRRSGRTRLVDFFSQSHNTINRLTGTTGEAPFAPYSLEHEVFLPDVELAIFVGIDESTITLDQMRSYLERIGDTGYGRDASTGLGRFQLAEDIEIDLSSMGSSEANACYTLAPCVPEKNRYDHIYFTPFTRFGRHGGVLAKSPNPFKNPIIMADEGAVLVPKERSVFAKPYIGTAVSGISKAEPGSLAQGYALYLPVRVEV